MKISYPKYYESFRCIANLCPDSCCHQWEVQVDEASAAYYRSMPGPLGDKLRQVLQDVDGEAVMSNTADGRCQVWFGLRTIFNNTDELIVRTKELADKYELVLVD